MKKSYTKPQLWSESFQPSDAVAGPCETDVGFGDVGAAKPCGLAGIDKDMPDIKLFNTFDACDTLWDDEIKNDQGCYHIPTTGVNYFGS